jgi:hypothetical protein
MEKRINKKIETYVDDLKKDLNAFIQTKDFECKYEIINYINSYTGLTLKKDDFVKRKRVKNVVPYYDRCTAKKASGDQCTRRKLKDCAYCGTHCKSQPYGVVSANEETEPSVRKVTVWAQDIKGIIYYLDNTGNVYDPSDVINNRKNPKIIAKYTKDDESEDGVDVYHIPSFGI